MMNLGSSSLTLAVLLGICSCAPTAHEPSKCIPTAGGPSSPKPDRPVSLNERGKITSISITDFYPLQQADRVLLFDARPAFFYTLGHIPGAISMPKDNCDAEIEKRKAEIKAAVSAGKTIVVYCTSMTCPDARSVAMHLADYTYSSSTLTGGWETWKESGL